MAVSARIGRMGAGVVLALALLAPASAGGATEQWVQMKLPPGAKAWSLEAVKVVSPKEAWAVGYTFGPGPVPSRALISRFDGSTWKQAFVMPKSRNSSSLEGVDFLPDGSEGWAVGYVQGPGGESRALVMHRKGGVWRRVRGADLPAVDDVLSDVAVRSSSDVWVVGQTSEYPGAFAPLVEHWDGSVWTRITAPGRGFEDGLRSIGAGADGTLVAVGKVDGESSVASPLTRPVASSAVAVDSIRQLLHRRRCCVEGRHLGGRGIRRRVCFREPTPRSAL
jgi:hypothetical protein